MIFNYKISNYKFGKPQENRSFLHTVHKRRKSPSPPQGRKRGERGGAARPSMIDFSVASSPPPAPSQKELSKRKEKKKEKERKAEEKTARIKGKKR